MNKINFKISGRIGEEKMGSTIAVPNKNLTTKELSFIDNYMETGNGTQAVIAAGYSSKSPSRCA